MPHAEREADYDSRFRGYAEQERQEDRYENEKRFSIDLSIREVELLQSELWNSVRESQRELQQALNGQIELHQDSMDALAEYISSATPLLERLDTILRQEEHLQERLRGQR